MKKSDTFLIAFFILSMLAFRYSSAQNVTVSGALAGNGTYSTLSAAFTAINGGTQTATNISILIVGNTTEPPTGAVLNQGTWSTILIQPSGGTARTISAAANPGTPLIDLNGADRVKIDGLNSGGNSLTISNTTVSGNVGTSTIRFFMGSTFNVVTRCSVLGSSLYGDGSSFPRATIIFGCHIEDLGGNNNNTISFCDIGPAGTNFPTLGIGSKGNPNFVTFNRGDTIRNCNIYDYFNTTLSSAGILLYSSKDISIINNKFYQTSPRSITQTSSIDLEHSAIKIQGEGDGSNYNNYTITGNTIGFSSSSGAGTYSINIIASDRGIFIRGINILNIDTTANAASVQGNTIAGISISAGQNLAYVYIQFTGIRIQGGTANVGDITGNIIGSQDEPGSITLSSNSTLEAFGIYSSALHIVCNNNSIAGITHVATNGSCRISCIGLNLGTNGTLICQNNMIGGESPNSIINMAAAGGSFGISNDIFVGSIVPKSIEMTGNIVRNLTSNFVPITGIYLRSQSADNTVSRNTVHSLVNINSDVVGMYFSGRPGTNLISGNFVHTLLTNDQYATITGIQCGGGNVTYKNNMVQIGSDTSGNNFGIGTTIYGVYDLESENNFYFNSIYIGGNSTGGSSNTFAFISTATGTRNYRNNIFYNSRSNLASVGKHYAIQVEGNVPNPQGLTINNNVYIADGVGGVFGRYNNIDRTSLSAWQSATGQDANSFNQDPHFIEPEGSPASVDLHIKSEFPSIINGNGFNIASVTDDYDGELRSGLTPVDIGADAVDLPLLYPNDIQLSNAKIENQVVISGNSYEIKASLINVGTNSQNSFPVYYTVNGGSPVGPVNAVGPFPQLGTEEIIFSDSYSFTPSLLGINTLKIYSVLSTDNYRGNDTVTLLINVQQKISSFPFVETFFNMSNWSVLLENPLYDIKLWELGLCTNPDGDNSDIAATSNCYLGAEGRREILKSPVLDLSSFTFGSLTDFPVLNFYTSYSGYLGLDDSLEVLLSTNNGLTFFSATTIFNKSRTTSPSLATRPVQFTEYFPDSSKQWRHEQINLSNVAGDSNVIIGFRSKSDFGNRQWIDNIIVTRASSFTSQTISSPGVFNFENISIDMNTVGLRPSIHNTILDSRHTGISKLTANKKKITGGFPGTLGHVSFNSNSEQDNPSGGVLTVVKYTYQNPVPSMTTPEIEQNDSITGATTGNGFRFTPNKVLSDVYFTASYTGNDYTGNANYDIRIKVSAISSIEDIYKTYIMKRADRTGQWKCQNTTVSGDTLISSGLDNFSDFSIGIYSTSKTLNLTLMIQGFYDATLNLMTEDTVRVFLRNSSSPYTIDDSAKAFADPSGSAVFNFSNITNGVPYYIQLKHRNSIETWSMTTQTFSSNTLTYDFTSAANQAFGSNMKLVDSSPVRYAIFSGDINKDKLIDLSDILLAYNASSSFTTGYNISDVTGDNISDLSDIIITYNNSCNFITAINP